MECVTISQTVNTKDFEVGNILWTEVQAFQDPNAHEVRGVVKLERDAWKMCLALISNPGNRELAWPAELRWKLFVVKDGETKKMGQKDNKRWNKVDIGKISWTDCIEVLHSSLQTNKLVDSDDSITFVWFAELAVAFSSPNTRETRETISEYSTEATVDTTDDEREAQKEESQGAGASQQKYTTQYLKKELLEKVEKKYEERIKLLELKLDETMREKTERVKAEQERVKAEQETMKEKMGTMEEKLRTMEEKIGTMEEKLRKVPRPEQSKEPKSGILERFRQRFRRRGDLYPPEDTFIGSTERSLVDTYRLYW